jgi:uncharacterized protein (DUF1800 family)
MSYFSRTIPGSVAAAAVVGIAALVCSSSVPASLSAASIPTDDKTIAHVLDRISYGARPGDVDRVRRLGVLAYIEQQLHPEKIDDRGLDARLSGLDTIDKSTGEIAREYYLPAIQQRRQQKKDQTAATPNDPTPRPRLTEDMQRQRLVMVELNEQKLLRATYSERQLEQVLTDFWFNHFNVFAGKGPERIMLTEYERDVIRPHVLGSFRELLGATAHSPAMLFYLDNWMSTDPDGPHATMADQTRGRRGRFGVGRPGRFPMPPQQSQQRPNNKRPTGLNENYGRELMELHTLGVDGGYTQKDVVEVARAFTGWTIAQPRQGGGFRFDPRMHDDGEKHVLGHTIKAGGGEHDGEQVLDILATHPSTARFISTKLVRRFVSDTPPPELVDRAAKRFLETKGDIREVVRTIVESPEFFSQESYRSKVKSPFEFVVSALRAESADIQGPVGLIRALQQLGMPLYQVQPPTGYADTADAWVNTGGLLNRMNFALALVQNKVQGVRIDQRDSGGTGRGDSVAAVRSQLVATLLQGNASEATLATLEKATDVPRLTALVLGAPEFQRK